MKDKRGSLRLAIESISAIPRAILVLIVIVAIVLVVNTYATRALDTYGLENSIMIKNLLYSEDCLAYSDNRVDIGLIDMNKFQENVIENCVGKGKGLKADLLTTNGSLIKEIKVGDDILTTYLNLCGIKKHDDFDCDYRLYYVRFKSAGGGINPGFLNVSLVRLKE